MIAAIIIMFVMGTAAFAGGYVFIYVNYKWKKERKFVLGIVLDCAYAHSERTSGAIYCKTVEYEIDGEKYENRVISESRYKQGKEIKLLYKPDDPNNIVHSRPFRSYAAAFGSAFIGAMCYWGAITLLLY